MAVLPFCLLTAKETKVVEIENDVGGDKQNSNHMAIEVMTLKTIAMIAKRPVMDVSY